MLDANHCTTDEKRNPFHLAVIKGNLELIKLMLDRCPEEKKLALITAKDMHGHDCIQMAKNMGNKQCMQMLINDSALFLPKIIEIANETLCRDDAQSNGKRRPQASLELYANAQKKLKAMQSGDALELM